MLTHEEGSSKQPIVISTKARNRVFNWILVAFPYTCSLHFNTLLAKQEEGCALLLNH